MTDTETAWNCLEVHGPAAEDGDPDLVIVLTATDADGRRELYCAGDAQDVLTSPDLYEGYTLVPTHLLSEADLAEIFGVDWRDGNGEWEAGDLVDDCRTECFLKHPDLAIIAVYVDRHSGHLGTVCSSPTCFRDIQRTPDRYAMYGTHTLPEWLLNDLFPTDD